MANYKHNQKVWLIPEKREATIIAIKTNYPSKTTTYVLENGKEVTSNELSELKPKTQNDIERDFYQKNKIPKMDIDNVEKSDTSIEKDIKTIEKLTKKRSGKNSDKSKSDK